jgi:flap endonuclease-1
MGKGIKLVYVFDGTPPDLKFKENQGRSERKLLAQEKYEEAASDDDYESMNKYSKQFVRLNKEMIEDSKKLVKALGLPVVQAPSEAEGQVAYMCKKGIVDYASSQDYDSLLFGAPQLVRNLTLSQKRKLNGGKTVFTFLELVQLQDVLKELGLTHEELIVLGILTGTDFNGKGVKGIGPKKALKLVKGCKDFDKMFSELNVDFDWKEVYNVFDKLPVDKNVKVKWENIDRVAIKELLVDKHEFNEERVNSMIDKYLAENKNANQKGLGDFF